jgi:hypothetical protein
MGEIISQDVSGRLKRSLGHYTDLTSLTSQLADITSQGLTCKQLKMTANDATKGADNFNKLVVALNQGTKILVDDVYYLQVSTTVNISTNVQLIGINPKAKFFLAIGTYFKIVTGCAKINISGVSFENTNNADIAILFTGTDTVKMDLIDVRNCSFTGNSSLIRWTSLYTVNPVIVDWGITELNFENNKVINNRNSFIQLPDVPFTSYNVINNKITNFDYVFFSSAINNSHSYPDQIISAMKTLTVKNNTVYNDDTWWGAGTGGTYYSFIVSETQKVYYEGNKVEGIKTDYLIAVYDAYLSCQYVEYKNNTWKNNICFSPSKANNTLMKAKGNGGSRYYDNNIFIIEKSYATRLNRDPNLLWVDLYSCTSQMDRWVMKNNIIDVYFLKYTVSSQTISEMWIENNTIKSTISSGTLLFYRTELGIDYSGKTHKLIGNTIVNSGLYDGTNATQLIQCVDYASLSNLYPSVVISDNRVVSTNLSYLLYSSYSVNTTVENNRIDIPESPTLLLGGYCFDGYVTNFQMSKNVFNKPNGKIYESRMAVAGKLEEDYIIKDYSGTNGNSNLALTINNPITVTYRYTRSYEIFSSAGYSNFSYTLDYSYDNVSGKNKVTFTDATSGLSNTFILGDGSGNNTNVKLIGTVVGSIVAKFNNSNGNIKPNFYLNGLADGYKTIKIKTYTAIV